MEKINYGKQGLDLVDRLLKLIESDSERLSSKHDARVTDPATSEQLRVLRSLGIRPLWTATRMEAEEMLVDYKRILASANRKPDSFF